MPLWGWFFASRCEHLSLTTFQEALSAVSTPSCSCIYSYTNVQVRIRTMAGVRDCVLISKVCNQQAPPLQSSSYMNFDEIIPTTGGKERHKRFEYLRTHGGQHTVKSCYQGAAAKCQEKYPPTRNVEYTICPSKWSTSTDFYIVQDSYELLEPTLRRHTHINSTTSCQIFTSTSNQIVTPTLSSTLKDQWVLWLEQIILPYITMHSDEKPTDCI